MGVIDGQQVRFRKRPMNVFPPLCLARPACDGVRR